jgi:tetratricopeptide (TPR) repeat protein
MSSTGESTRFRISDTPKDSSFQFHDEPSSTLHEDGGPEWQLNKLYGRDQESQTIQALADDRSTNILILHGTAGSGKSSLIERQPWERRGWIFAAGKYEKSRMNEPYSGLIVALNSLVDQWFENNQHSQVSQMPSFHTLLDEDIQFLKNVIPHAFNLAGAGQNYISDEASIVSSRPNTTLEGAEYVYAGFWRILSFLCEPRPIVLFLDDVQWADQTSLDALKMIASTGNIKGLLLVVAYRQEVVVEGDRTSTCLQAIEASGQTVHKICVSDLTVLGVNELVARVLSLDLEQTRDLSIVIHSKTAGNPFFVLQFLRFLRLERFLTYSSMTFQWNWGDIDQLEKFAHISDNVAEVIAATMSKLPIPTRLSLQVASCLGKNIPLYVIIKYFDDLVVQSDMLMDCDVLKSVQMYGLKSVLDEAVKYGILTRSDDQAEYTWAHDKLQQVAYSMIPKEILPQMHVKLGKLLWKMSSDDDDDEWMLFMAAYQLNRFADDDVSGGCVSEDLAQLSLEAGKLSLSKSALYPALEMLRCAAKHIGPVENAWNKAYDLCLELYSCLGEVAIRLGNYDEAMSAVTKVLRHSKCSLDKFRVQVVLLLCQSAGNDRNYRKSADSIRDILRDYKVKLPKKVLPGQQYLESRKLKARLGGNLEAFMDLHRLDASDDTDRRYQNITVMLAYFGRFTYFVPPLRPLGLYMCTRGLNISIKHGICPATALVLSLLAVNLTLIGQRKEALEYGNFAIKLVDSFPLGLGSAHAAVRGAVTFSVIPSSLPFNDMLDRCLEVNQMGLKTGDTEKASTALMVYSFAYLCVGLPVGPLKADLVSFAKEAKQLGMANTVQVLYSIFRQTIHNLRTTHQLEDPTLLKGEFFDQEKDLSAFNGQGLIMTKRDVNTFRLMLACFYRKWTTAAELVDALEFCLDTDSFLSRAHLRSTYMGIACLVLGQQEVPSGDSSNRRRSRRYRQLGKKIIKRFKDDIKGGSQNAYPVLLVLEAIEFSTKERYDLAIRTCGRLGLIQLEAIAYEFAGLHYLKAADRDWAEYYLEHAHNLYCDWGAIGKSNQLNCDHRNVLREALNYSARGSALKGRSRYDPDNITQLSQVDFSSSNIRRSSWMSSPFTCNDMITNERKNDTTSTSTGGQD